MRGECGGLPDRAPGSGGFQIERVPRKFLVSPHR
jgi:hypothetical protein